MNRSNKFNRDPDPALRLFQVMGPDGLRYFNSKHAAKLYRDKVSASHVSYGPDHWRRLEQGEG